MSMRLTDHAAKAILALGIVLGLAACSPSEETELRVLSWQELMPPEELDMHRAISEGRADPGLASQLLGNSPIFNQTGTFNAVEELNGASARMPGYILPLDFTEHGAAYEFLLLPYHGACIHRPPPPPNQIVYLRSEEPISFGALWEPVWVEGLMSIERVDTDLAATAYSMAVENVEPYTVE